MKVDHVSFSGWGGAGSVAKSLHESQSRLGVDSLLHTVIEKDLRRDPLSRPGLTTRATLDKYLVTKRDVPTLTSYFRSTAAYFDTSQIREDSVPHFHWMEGVMTPEQISAVVSKSGRGVWTLHDMAPLSGFCHQALSCDGFKTNCANCPQAQSLFRKSISSSLSSKRATLMKVSELLKVSAPSRWLANKARQSAVFSEFEINVIFNPINIAFFLSYVKGKSRHSLGLSERDFVATIVASDLNDPNKRVLEATRVFLEATDKNNIAGRLLLVGNGVDSFPLKDRKIVFTGKLSPQELPSVINCADIIISSSVVESAGLTIAEAAALGVPSLVLGNGAVEEMLIPNQTGYLVSDFRQLGNKLADLMNDSESLGKVAASAKEFSRSRFHPDDIARKYMDLYQAI